MIIVIPLLCLSMLLAVPEALGQAESADYEREFDETYPIDPKADVEVEHSFGNVNVQTWDQGEVRVWARIETKGEGAREFGEQVRIEVDAKDKTFRVKTHYPERDDEEMSFGVELKIWMPPTHDLDLENAYGQAALWNIKGDVEADVSYGQLHAQGLQGEIDLTSAFGNLALENSEGKTKVEVNNGSIRIVALKAESLKVKNSGGSIGLFDIQGDVEINCSSGKIEARNVKGGIEAEGEFGNHSYQLIEGPLKAAGKNCSIDAKKVAGPVRIDNAFGNIVVHEIAGDVRLETKNGSVTAVKIEGSARIENAFGDVGAIEVAGDLKVRDKNGSVHVKSIGGNTDIKNAYGNIKADDLQGDVKLENEHGQIRVDISSYWNAKTEKGNRIQCSTSMGLIQLDLPGPPSFELDAATTFGRIRSDFVLSGVEREATSQKARCTLGKGSAEIKLRTTHGDISLVEKGKEPTQF